MILPISQCLFNGINQDPVSQREIDRNNAVYNLQKNRNPFIDNPSWVNAIWGKLQILLHLQPRQI
ncbi:endonuclease [Chryseobacterium indoltheticum]|uniref:endonuclease n=1 Tax=Chryseobacterium indoltheticum TaxID=254 RepID=UPI003F4939C8